MQTKAFQISFDITQIWLKIAPKQHILKCPTLDYATWSNLAKTPVLASAIDITI